MNTRAADPGPEAEALHDELTERFAEVVQRLSGFADIDDEDADGLLTAAALYPEPPDIDEWLPVLVADDAFERCFADPADAAMARETLVRWLQRIVAALDPPGLIDGSPGSGLRPLIREWTAADRAQALAGNDDPELARWLFTGAGWAHGVMRGMEAFADHAPTVLAGAPLREFANCLMAIAALTWGERGELWDQHVAQQWRGARPSRGQLIDAAAGAAEEIRLLWLDAALKPAPRIAGEKIGRNDPCPCGSGKKYKRCHGSA